MTVLSISFVRTLLYFSLFMIFIPFFVSCNFEEHKDKGSSKNITDSLSLKTKVLNEQEPGFLQETTNEVSGEKLTVQQEIVNLYPFKIIDSSGDSIEFKKPPNRIVAFDAVALETIFRLGKGAKIVGTHDFVSYPPEAENIVRVGGAFNMNIEAIVGLNPDLVFVFSDQNIGNLKNAGLKVLYIKSLNNDFSKILDEIIMWGMILNVENKAEEIVLDFEKRLNKIETTVENLNINQTIFQDVGDLWTPGRNTLMDDVFVLLNLSNIALDVEGYAQISREVIVDRNPDLIITLDSDTITKDPAFNEISAVENNRVYTLPSNALSIGGPRFINGIEELALLIYPENVDLFLNNN